LEFEKGDEVILYTTACSHGLLRFGQPRVSKENGTGETISSSTSAHRLERAEEAEDFVVQLLTFYGAEPGMLYNAVESNDPSFFEFENADCSDH
jgi:hypothetical protein